MRRQFTSVVVAFVFAVTSLLAVMPVSKASAINYGTYCANYTFWAASSTLYTYHAIGTNMFCSLNINPSWGTKRMISMTVSRPGRATMYDGGQYYYYAGPLVYNLYAGQCATVMGIVANLDMTNQINSSLSVCNR